MKTFLVEQLWSCQGLVVPVRASVVAKSKKKAEKVGDSACKDAADRMGASRIGAKPKSKVQVLYAV